ncbi:MAG: hypothetical protein EOO53_08905 [Gammaproteobacteria bacterium]|nr:MAG: hypothetical protein EOO53_08905 [Gammaproteobacteria bacterium]
MLRKIYFCLFVLTASSFAYSAFAEKNGDYEVSAAITSNGVLLGKPTLFVISGVDASVQMSGENGYKFSLNVTPSANNTVLAKSSVKTNSGDINPSLMLEIGKESIVKSDGVELHLLVNKAGS